MPRFLFLFFILIAHQANANLFDTSEQALLTQQLKELETQLNENNEFVPSVHYIKELQAVQVNLAQFFADSAVDDTNKIPLLELYASLNQTLYLLGGAQVQSPQIKELERGSNGSGIIRGFVRNDLDESPISGATIRLYSSSGVYLGYKTADSIGRFIFSELEDGQYLIAASSTSGNFVTEFYEDYLCPGGLGYGCQTSDLTALEVIDGLGHEQINFNLSKQGRIIGVLKDQANNEAVSGTVKMYNQNNEWVSSVNTSYSTGEFTMYSPDTAQYYLKFESSSHRTTYYDGVECDIEPCNLSGATTVSVLVSDELDLGSILLSSYSRISGKVTAAQNGSISGFNSVQIIDAAGNSYNRSVYPDSYGNWSSDPIPQGTYHVRTNASGYIAQYFLNKNCLGYSFSTCDGAADIANTVNHDGVVDTTGINFNLRQGGKIQGQVFDSLNNSISAEVRLYDESGRSISDQRTDNNGNYSFSGLSDGSYYISAYHYEHQLTLHPRTLCSDISYSDRCNSATEGDVIVLANATTVTRHVAMRVGATIKGQITNTENVPLANADVTFVINNRNHFAPSDANGMYEMKNLPAGTVKFVAYKSNHARVLWHNNVCSESGCDIEQGTAINVSGNNIYSGKNFSLPELGSVTFIVKDRNNQAVSDGSIYVYKDSGSYVNSYGLNSSGLAELKLYPGRYQFVYKSNYGKKLDRVYGGNNCYQNCQSTTGTAINVSNGQSRSANMTLDDAFILKGTIREEVVIGNNWKYIKIYQGNELVSTEKVHNGVNYEKVIKYPGSIKVEAYQHGHYSAYYQGVECSGDGCGLSQATTINVIPNQVKTIDFNLRVLNHFSGKVVNADGAPLAGIQLNAILQNSYNDYYVTSDENGRFKFSGLQPGNYNFRAKTDGVYQSTLYGNQACPNPCEFNDSHIVEINEGDFLNNRNITMQKRGRIEVSGTTFVSGGFASDVNIRFINQSNNNSYSFETDDFGNAEVAHLPSGSYKILANVDGYNNNIYTAYPGISCSSSNTDLCLSLSPEFVVTGQSVHLINDLKVDQNGKIIAQIRDESTNEAVSDILVQLIDYDLDVLRESSSYNQGTVEINGIDSGTYYAYAKADSYDEYQSELFDNISCGGGLGIDCLLPQGTAIQVEKNSVQNIVFTLKKKPKLTVNLNNAFTGDLINGEISVFSASGNRIRSSNDLSIPLNAGQYYVVGHSAGFDYKAYPSASCQDNYSMSSCDLSSALLVTINDQDKSIDLGLDLIEGISGIVTNAYTGEPIEGVVIDFWRYSSSVYGSAITNQNGRFSYKLRSYWDYWVSTDVSSNLNLYNEVYNNKLCFHGPAVLDYCDPFDGELVVLSDDAPRIIEFKLDGDHVFKGGFELD